MVLDTSVRMWSVKVTRGGLPLGGQGSCDIFAVDPLPHILEDMPDAFPGAAEGDTKNADETWREDLSARIHGQRAFLIHNILTAEESNAILTLSEQIGFSEAAPEIATPPGMRMNLSCHWVSPRRWMHKVFERIRHDLPQEIDGKKLLGLSYRLNMYKYLENMHFKPHVDGDWPAYAVDEHDTNRMFVLDREKHGHSKLSMLLYLNDASDSTDYDGVEGGNTRLYSRQTGGKSYEVSPRKGSALFFCHGFGPDSVLHEGCNVQGAKPKYVVRINVMYEADDD